MINKNKEIIEDLQASEYLFRTVIDTSSTSYLLYDSNTGFIDYVNPAFSQTFGDDLPTINDWWSRAFLNSQYREEIATEWMIKIHEISQNPQIRFDPMEVYVSDTSGHLHWVIMESMPLNQDETQTQLVTIYDITEIKKAEHAAEQLAKSKSEFLANMSHEIRTPINAILGLAFVLSKKTLSSDENLLVSKILTSGELLLGIINDILDISKIESDKLELEHTHFDVDSVLQNVETIMAFSASEKGINLQFNSPSDLKDITLIGDSLRLKQVLINLTSNAIKFTEEGTVCVTAKCVKKTLQRISLSFSVQDTGIGITQQAQQNIFTPFEQADTSITRNYGGTGLGLTISRKLVELMDGEIWLESEIGEGSIFSFTIDFDIAEKSENSLPIDNTSDEASMRLLGFRLLIVDDNDINLEVAKRIFSAEGAIIITAGNGLEALEWLKENPTGADIVLMDIQMPVMDGCEATNEIRKIPELAKIPIVALSAGVLKMQMDKVQRAGIQDFIMKPFNVDVAVNLMRKILGTHFIETAATQITKSADQLPKFEGVDLEAALENWKEMRVYQTYLIQFLNDFEPDLDIMETFEIDDLADFAHKTKGAARVLGLFDVGDACEELEFIADDNQNPDEAIAILKKTMSIASNSIHLIVQHL
jgi:PAS domain S-box-containing protein